MPPNAKHEDAVGMRRGHRHDVCMGTGRGEGDHERNGARNLSSTGKGSADQAEAVMTDLVDRATRVFNAKFPKRHEQY